MVVGRAVDLAKFREHFAPWQDSYVLIGGVATWLLLEEAGLAARATKDLDIVLCIETLQPDFGRAFWEFVTAGGYPVREKSSGERVLYRFRKPSVSGYPAMLELFSRKSIFDSDVDAHLAPIVLDGTPLSLSAILLDDAYYDFLLTQKREIEGLSVLGAEGLIPLKACAWLDLTERKQRGEPIHRTDIQKHHNDVLRLYQLLPLERRVVLPDAIRADFARFLQGIGAGLTANALRNLGFTDLQPAEVIARLRATFG